MTFLDSSLLMLLVSEHVSRDLTIPNSAKLSSRYAEQTVFADEKRQLGLGLHDS